MARKAAFFYGTLLHPRVLKRVIGNDGSHLTICPAILPEHTRHQIKDCDYPGVVPYTQSQQLFSHELSDDERSVRGNVVVGLSERDVEFLDLFEGNEYTRVDVTVYKLGPLKSLNHPSQSVVSTKSEILPPLQDLESIEATIYIWTSSMDDLVPELWSYEVFMRENAWKWVGVGPTETREEYAEVDKRREMNGIIERAAEKAVTQGVLN